MKKNSKFLEWLRKYIEPGSAKENELSDEYLMTLYEDLYVAYQAGFDKGAERMLEGMEEMVKIVEKKRYGAQNNGGRE